MLSKHYSQELENFLLALLNKSSALVNRLWISVVVWLARDKGKRSSENIPRSVFEEDYYRMSSWDD
jgi:hypothetical protein